MVTRTMDVSWFSKAFVRCVTNKELEVYVRKTEFENAGGGFYPQGVKDCLEYYRKVLAPMSCDEGEALRELLPSDLVLIPEIRSGS